MTPQTIARFRYLAREDNPDVPQRDAARMTVNRAIGTEEYPPIIRQVAEAIRAGMASAATGFAQVMPEEYERRLAICRPCGHYDGHRCRLCGCFSSLKARLETEHCPIKKW